MQSNKFDRNSGLKEKASELRKNMTRHERHLWYDFLMTHRYRWRRQQIINNYIADFYCSKAMLAVELDGSQHYEDAGISYDKKRTKKIEEYDIEILRFTNREVDENFQAVCETIDKAAEERIHKKLKKSIM